MKTFRKVNVNLFPVGKTFRKVFQKSEILIEFAYNNSYHSSIGMAPYEALYDRMCRTPVCWSEVRERQILGPKLVQVTTDKVKVIQDRLKVAQSRQTIYADKSRKHLEFEAIDRVFLRVSHWKGVLRFEKRENLFRDILGPTRF